jgi:hypothetical protein
MLVSVLFERINYALRGQDDEAPQEGSEEAIYWLNVINRKKDEWATDPFENWSSLFGVRDLTDPIEAGTQTYALDSDFVRPADTVYVTVGTQKTYFNLVEPQLRDSVPSSVYITGKVLNFTDEIEADSSLITGDITVPAFFQPADLTAFTDTVPVDDPNWLALAVASELAFSDVTYEDKAPDLLGMANDLYLKMKAGNRKGTITSPRKAQTKVNPIGSQTDW